MSNQSVLTPFRVGGVILLCLVSIILLLHGCDDTEVKVVSPRRGEIRESFTEPARTRLEKTYPITMPVTGRIGRIDLEPGHGVKAGQELVEFDRLPLEKTVEAARAAVAGLRAEIAVKDDNNIERTAIVESQAAIDAARKALKASGQQVAAEKARSSRADKELHRMESLKAGQAIPQTKLDDVTLAAETSLLELRRQQFYRAALNALFVAVRLGPRYVEQYLGRKSLERRVLVHRLEEAEANLARTVHKLKLAGIVSPINGVVLARHEQGDGTLPAGKPLMLLGNLGDMEAVADVMTQDALWLREGSEVSLVPSAGREPIPGRVKRIEPAGFTKLSSLGVEQQRVKVIVSVLGKHSGLGVGYRLQARFFTGMKSGALLVPRFSVMQDADRSFYVFKVVDGELKKQPVKIGLRSDLELEITAGLSDADRIVERPDAAMKDGMAVSPVE